MATGSHYRTGVDFGARADIYRMVDGKVAEEWNTIEQLDLMVQIGALKLP